jgi:acyl-CoA synthetase (NDP forming)
MDVARIAQIVKKVSQAGREVLLEPEGLQVLRMMGVPVPPYLYLEGRPEVSARSLDALTGDRVVLKAISPEVLHKSEERTIRIVAREPAAVRSAIGSMEETLRDRGLQGFTIHHFVPYVPALGNELLLSMRWSDDFGPLVTLGLGGVHVEQLAERFPTMGRAVVISPRLMATAPDFDPLAASSLGALLTTPQRGYAPIVDGGALGDFLRRFVEAAEVLLPELLEEVEINPLVVHDGKLVALDVLARRAPAPHLPAFERPTQKIDRLLHPESIAVVGVSQRMNPGRVILQNILRAGFDPERVFVVKSGLESLEGCRCVADVRSLPERVDLLILAVAAERVPEILTSTIAMSKAESVIVIPGGLEEKAGSEAIIADMQAALARARTMEWQGPVVNGGNCLGIRSRPGRYDTLFLPSYKMPEPRDESQPAALISQSGAFLAAKMSKLQELDFRYAISVGNQFDLTIGDYLAYLGDDPELEVFAVYAEGFRKLDGMKFLQAARQIAHRGGTVILYRAGRTAAGAAAAASHTASIAGDYTVTRSLAAGVGVVVAETMADFEDLVGLFLNLRGKSVTGWRVAMLSNAGFECVAISDSLEWFEPASFSATTLSRLQTIFSSCGIDRVVDPRNPLDVTPMMGDAAFEAAVRAVLEDEGVDAAVVGCVPLTGELDTLAPGRAHPEDVTSPDSVAGRLAGLFHEYDKPWVAVVDAGRPYDPMADQLRRAGIPTFRTAERAVRLFEVFTARRLSR